jgi:hypothetical protein
MPLVGQAGKQLRRRPQPDRSSPLWYTPAVIRYTAEGADVLAHRAIGSPYPVRCHGLPLADARKCNAASAGQPTR